MLQCWFSRCTFPKRAAWFSWAGASFWEEGVVGHRGMCWTEVLKNWTPVRTGMDLAVAERKIDLSFVCIPDYQVTTKNIVHVWLLSLPMENIIYEKGVHKWIYLHSCCLPVSGHWRKKRGLISAVGNWVHISACPYDHSSFSMLHFELGTICLLVYTSS